MTSAFLDLENSLNFAYQQIECDIHHLLNDMCKSQLYIFTDDQFNYTC